nr:MAG TPA: hypothetical protein [Bacteriophage sp.]
MILAIGGICQIIYKIQLLTYEMATIEYKCK